MPFVDIAADEIALDWHGPAGANIELRTYALNDFLTAEGDPVVAGSPYTGGRLYRKDTCTYNGSKLVVPVVRLPSNEDSLDLPGSARWGCFLFDVDRREVIGAFSVFGSFSLPPTPANTTWAQIRQHQQAVQAINPFGNAHTVNRLQKWSANGFVDSLAAEVGGALSVPGDITAQRFFGSGAGLTNIPGKPGGVAFQSISNAGPAWISADTDESGDGLIDFLVRNVSRAKFQDGGELDLTTAFLIRDDANPNRNVQALINGAQVTGGVVQLGANIYGLNAELVVHSGVTLRGVGRRTVLRLNGDIRGIVCAGDAVIEDLCIDGQQTGTGVPGADLIFINNSTNVRVRRCTLINSKWHGVSIWGGSDNWTVEGCRIVNVQHTGVYCHEGSNDGTAAFNAIDGCQRGINIQAPTIANYRHTVAFNKIVNVFDMAIELWGPGRNINCTVVGNKVDRGTGTGGFGFGISLDYAYGCTVTGNTIMGAWVFGLEAAGNDHCTYGDNTVDGAAMGAHISQKATNISFTGNIFRNIINGIEIYGGAGSSGRTNQMTDITICQNQIYGNGTGSSGRGIFFNQLGVNSRFQCQGNTVTHMGGAGIYFFETDGGIVAGNISVGNQLSGQPGEDNYFYNLSAPRSIARIERVANVGDWNRLNSYLHVAISGGGPLKVARFEGSGGSPYILVGNPATSQGAYVSVDNNRARFGCWGGDGIAVYADGNAALLSGNKFGIRNNFTPIGAADPAGAVGDLGSDDDYLYRKSSAGWKRIAWTAIP